MNDTSLHRIIIPALWLMWLAYWTVAAFGAKRTERRESTRSRWGYLTPLIAGSVLLATPHLSAVLDRRLIPHSDIVFWIAIAILATGLGFASLARAWLGRNWSGTVTLKENHELIRSGPYRMVRHPIYTGLILAIAGTALAIGEVRALIGFVLIVYSSVVKLRIEERFMAEQFGDEYRRYKTEVPALVPFLL